MYSNKAHKILLQLVFAVVLGSLLAGCSVNPATGEQDLVLMSENQEITLGRSGHEEILQEYGKYDDPELAAYVDDIGQRIASVSHRSNLQYTVRVVDSPIVKVLRLLSLDKVFEIYQNVGEARRAFAAPA